MQNATLNKIQWVELFHSAGLDEAMMHEWHHLFEQRSPEAYQDFLESLGIEAEEIQISRHMSKQNQLPT